MRRSAPILLAPAGNIPGAIQAFAAGADAIYVGLKGWSRGGARNELSPEEVRQCAQIARDLSRGIHLAVNVIPTPKGRLELLRRLDEFAGIGLNAVIVNDIGLVRELRQALPQVSITISIGCTALNFEDARFFEEIGATSLVLPGHLDPQEITAIKKRSSIRLEIMLHMVEEVNQLGRCWMPSYVNFAAAEHQPRAKRLSGSVKRGGVGACFRICETPWTVLKHSEAVDQRTLPSRQISRIGDVPAFLNAGVAAIKIQGRSLTSPALARIVAHYRSAMDAWATGQPAGCTTTAGLPRMWTVQGR